MTDFNLYDAHGNKIASNKPKAMDHLPWDWGIERDRGATVVDALPEWNEDGYSIVGCQYIYPARGRAGEYSRLAISPYRGCGYLCGRVYCYVVRELAKGYAMRFPQLRGEENWAECLRLAKIEFTAGAKERTDFRAHFMRDLKKYALKGSIEQAFMSFMSDVYHLGNTALTRWVMHMILEHSDMAFSVLTKGGWLSARDFDLYRATRDSYGFTLCSLDAKYTRSWEGKTAAPEDRIAAALLLLKKRGVWLYCSIEPVTNVEHALAVIDRLYQVFGTAIHLKVGPLSTEGNDLDGLPQTKEYRLPTDEEHVKLVLETIERCTKRGVSLYLKEGFWPFIPDDYKAHNAAQEHVVQHH